MSELRYDALQRRWVIIATEREHRPQDFYTHQDIKPSGGDCPFCPGNEDQTPPEITAIRPEGSKSNDSDWHVRVTQNKYPALQLGEIDWELGEERLYERTPGHGVHEVIIEGQDHNKSMDEFSPELIFDIMKMYRNRLSVHMQNLYLKYTLIFKNHGVKAGASLVHPHSQLIATPVTPRTIRIELMSTLRYFAETGNCMICDMIERERVENSRVVYDDGVIVAFNSFAARFPFELLVVPVKHSTFFEHEDDRTLRHLGICLKDILGRLRKALNDPPYNYMLHSGPNTEAKPIFPGFWSTLEKDFHWHIEIIPRLVRTAGFEWGSGLHINPVPPERATAFLNEIEL